MESRQFDRLARAFGALRSRRAAAAMLGGLLAAPFLTSGDAEAGKKKKKPCKKTCKTGCCTGKRGTCIKPGQQSLTRCGTGGAICRSTGCGCLAGAPCPAGQCCRGDGSCGACLVFFSSARPAGNPGGLTGADRICQDLATAAGLPGTYMAWLSDTTGSPSTRFTRATAPYTLVNGTQVAANWAALVSGTLAHAIDLTETGASVSGIQAWTNTLPNGTTGGVATPGDCGNWLIGSGVDQGNTGLSASTAGSWTFFSNKNCRDSNERGLYCFQQR